MNVCLCAEGFIVCVSVCVCVLKVIRAAEQIRLPLFRQMTSCGPAAVLFTPTLFACVRKLNLPQRAPDGPVCAEEVVACVVFFYTHARAREKDEVALIFFCTPG